VDLRKQDDAQDDELGVKYQQPEIGQSFDFFKNFKAKNLAKILAFFCSEYVLLVYANVAS
jgi:hypothetical protein